ncbi:UDPglucose 6-dehydrogenase [Galdieria sulphuraria]|uniref:UDP-glucose 6-dehydrogenase n=1 Tax=Galdieria sulphuraria TaxID=130081 RepID=M2XL19_GALSU|nr:UDPglucose 6-dehydrogenase [Galdieria sulphuraria]EME30827.1 UDPglucose 6-dehydrogenase [Galdieria sulphuraria]|eukprot:XP_005707347.1 UDPglucose 6-dehydrogenase [Galdieria sulphuraria]
MIAFHLLPHKVFYKSPKLEKFTQSIKHPFYTRQHGRKYSNSVGYIRRTLKSQVLCLLAKEDGVSDLCVSFFGAGYVGLVSSVCLADYCKKVYCLDTDKEKIASLRELQIPIYEPLLEDKLRKNYESKRLVFLSETFDLAIRDSDILFIAVGTPSRRGDGHADLSYVFSVAELIAEMLTPGYTLIVIKSTVPVGTCNKVQELMKAKVKSSKVQFDVVSNPEFLRQGSAVENFLHPDRVVVGGCGSVGSPARKRMEILYSPFVKDKGTLLFTSWEEAEMIKYAANAFLALKIQFTNEFADFCQLVNANISVVMKAIGLDERIGSHYLQPGPGFGGSCLPKDIRALVRSAQEYSCSMRLLESVIDGNEVRKRRIAQWIATLADGSCTKEDVGIPLHGHHTNSTTINVYGKRFAILGLTFKANTDDLRESPAIYVVQELLSLGALVSVYDPQVKEESVIRHFENFRGFPLNICEDTYTACKDADVTAILTEWEEFRNLDWSRLYNIV